jgi:hypothetical protein
MELQLPPGYYLELDPDVWMLRRSDGRAVAAFSARGATKESIEQEAWADYRPPILDDRKTERENTAKGRPLRSPLWPPRLPG